MSGAREVEQGRFQRTLYLTVTGMSLGGCREAGSAHTTYDSKEEGVGGPPTQALGEREQRSRQWIASLAEGDRVNAAPPPFPSVTGSGRSLPAVRGRERHWPMQSCLDLVKRVRDWEYSKP